MSMENPDFKKENLETVVRELLFDALGHEPDLSEMEKAGGYLRRLASENRRMSGEYERLFELLERDPRLALFFSETLKGTPVRVALMKADIVDTVPQYGDDDWNAYQVELAEHKRKKEEYLKALEEHKRNCAATAEEVERFYRDKKLSDSECDSFADYVEALFDDIVRGIITPATLERLWQGYTMEERIREAHDKGVVDGRNIRLEELRRSVETDGIPDAGTAAVKSAKRGYIERILRGDYR